MNYTLTDYSWIHRDETSVTKHLNLVRLHPFSLLYEYNLFRYIISHDLASFITSHIHTSYSKSYIPM